MIVSWCQRERAENSHTPSLSVGAAKGRPVAISKTPKCTLYGVRRNYNSALRKSLIAFRYVGPPSAG